MLSKFSHLLLKPLYGELPFFILFFFFISQTAFKTLVANWRDLSYGFATITYLCLSVLICYVLTSFIHYTKSKLVKWGFYCLGIILFAVYVFLWLVFGTSLSPVIIVILGETNFNESSEFLNAFLFSPRGIISMACILIMIGIVILFEKHKTFIQQKVRLLAYTKKTLITVLLIFILLIGLWKGRMYCSLLKTSTTEELERWCHDNSPYYPMDMITTLVYSLQGPISISHDINIARKVARNVYSSRTTINSDSALVVVYILGESYIKQHASIYGYQLPTTPNLSKEESSGNLYVFRDVVSAFNSTTEAEKNTFSLNRLSNNEYWYDYPIFPTVFKKAGYKVYMWDMQRSFDDNAIFTFSVNSFLYDKEISKLTYTEYNDKQFKYDGQMIDDFQNRHPSIHGNTLIIYHLLGQHVDAGDRYPHKKEFERFKSTDIERNESWMTEAMKHDIANYDNATYYNDCLLGNIFNYLRNKNAVLVYLSDHGEEIYDYRPLKGRSRTPMSEDLLEHQFAIPFVVWCSDRYKALHPDIIKSLQKAISLPMMSDNVGHMLLHLGGISSPYYKSENDILNKGYKQVPRYVANGVLYK